MKKSELRQIIKEEIQRIKEEQDEYDVFFKKAAEKFGIDPDEIDEIPKEKKKEFFNYVDKNWKAKSEKD